MGLKVKGGGGVGSLLFFKFSWRTARRDNFSEVAVILITTLGFQDSMKVLVRAQYVFFCILELITIIETRFVKKIFFPSVLYLYS